MPRKVKHRRAVKIEPNEYTLLCEWGTCQDTFTCMDEFTNHVGQNLNTYIALVHQGVIPGNKDLVKNGLEGVEAEERGAVAENQRGVEAEDQRGAVAEDQMGLWPRSNLGQRRNCLKKTKSLIQYNCQWASCGAEVEDDVSTFLRHVYFHVFHVKIKSIGSLLMEKTGSAGCTLDDQGRNLIPELPERLQCSWELCSRVYDNAQQFYDHVEAHADVYPEGNVINEPATCLWEGCGLNTKNRYKVREHLRSHTQEKVIACPQCGGLFSSRTKFHDHLSRQAGLTDGKRYQCSHCNKIFAAERLLRDHMRNHLNQYKCPYCDMTSPSPACLRLHMKYRHNKDKPFCCENCDYRGKSNSDLRRHLETHSMDPPFQCQSPGCDYTSRGYHSLANHFKRVHQSLDVANYACHVCSALFTRGAILTKHLKKKHKFIWPSGHSRFKYAAHTDGKYRLQTIRYESIELTTQSVDDKATPDDDTESVHSSCVTDSNDIEMKDLDEENHENIIPLDLNSELSSSDSNNNDQGSKVKGSKVKGSKVKASCDSNKDVVITLTADPAGGYVLQSDASISVKLLQDKDVEDTMYNLQMLGDVAIGNKKM